MGAAVRRQVGSDAAIGTSTLPMTSVDAPDRQGLTRACQVVVLDVVDSSPIVHPKCDVSREPGFDCGWGPSHLSAGSF